MVLNFACSSFNPSIGTSIVFFNWYQVLNLFPRSSIAFESQLVLSIFLLLLHWWRSILRFVSNFLLTPFFILMIALSTRGRKFWHKDGSYKWFLQEEKDFGVVATFVVVNTLL